MRGEPEGRLGHVHSRKVRLYVRVNGSQKDANQRETQLQGIHAQDVMEKHYDYNDDHAADSHDGRTPRSAGPGNRARMD